MRRIFLSLFILLYIFSFSLGCKDDGDNNKGNENNNDGKEVLKELSIDELKERFIFLVNSYENSLTGSLDINLVNGSDKYDINLKYNLSDIDQIVAYEYNVNQLISGNEIKQYTYVKDGMVHSMVNGNSGADQLDDDATEYIIDNCGVSVILEKVIPFYEDDSFYTALSFSKKINETTLEYTLDISNYNGATIDITKNDSILFNVTIIKGFVTSVELISNSVDGINKVKVSFNGLETPTIIYPESVK